MRRLVSALLLTLLMVATSGVCQAETLTEFFHRPSTQGVTIVSRYKGRTTYRYTYPGYTEGFPAPGWIKFGYPGENYPTSRNFGGPGYVGF